MTVGPIQLIAITFDDYKPKGHIIREVNAQAEAGVIRLVDAQFVRKTHDGHVLTGEITGLSDEEAAEFGAVIGGLIGAGAGDAGAAESRSISAALAAAEESYGLSLQDVHRIADELEPGNAVALLLIEHTWAIGFRDAVKAASGNVVAQGFLTPDTLIMVGRELEAQAEALEAAAKERAAAAKLPATAGDPPDHSLAYVEGIGPTYAQQLKDAGVTSTQELLEAGATPRGRAELAEASGISGKLILEWVNHVDLFRIQGVGSEYADLLEAAGVDTVPELAQRNPENLQKKLSEINEEKKLVRQVPSAASVANWVEQAKSLARKITY